MPPPRSRLNVEHVRRERNSAWILLGDNGYGGFRSCCKCGELAYCRGRFYDRQMCEDCFLA